MGWRAVVGTGSILVAVAGGCWWTVAASATPPAPVIGPAVVVTPATRSPSPTSAGPSRSSATARPRVTEPDSPPPPPSATATATSEIESPEVVDPQWVRPIDGGEDDDAAGVHDD